MQRWVAILNAPVAASAQQGAVSVEERSSYWDPALCKPCACLLDGNGEPLRGELAIEPANGMIGSAHGSTCLPKRTCLHLDDSPATVGAVTADRTYRATVGSQLIDLPLVQVAPEVSIALLICVDHGVRFAETAGRELAAQLEPLGVEIVASVATMGIPLAIEVTRALGLDDYAILHKTPKIHLANAIDEPVRSITTDRDQRLLFDRARQHVIEGRRVAIVDDVISTGGSSRAALNLIRKVGGEPVAFGALLTEGGLWRTVLGEDASMVHALGAIPLFRHQSDGSLVEDWGPTD
jgi:adenine phosphoribosyltransferase